MSSISIRSPREIAGGVDPTLALLGAQGWEIRGIAPLADGGVMLALQRPLDEPAPLPDAPTLAATLDAPLTVPDLDDLEALGSQPR